MFDVKVSSLFGNLNVMDRAGRITDEWRSELPGDDVNGLVTWGLLKRASAMFDRSLAPLMEGAGVNMGEFEVLAVLRRAGPPYQLRPSDLTKSLIVTPGAITNRLTTLERRDLIVRRGLADDRRGVVVALTAKGLYLFDTAFESVVARCHTIMEELGEVGPLKSALRALLLVLEADEAGDRAQAAEPADPARADL
jgi:DNA-binding MarR family transcriptional regulator